MIFKAPVSCCCFFFENNAPRGRALVPKRPIQMDAIFVNDARAQSQNLSAKEKTDIKHVPVTGSLTLLALTLRQGSGGFRSLLKMAAFKVVTPVHRTPTHVKTVK